MGRRSALGMTMMVEGPVARWGVRNGKPSSMLARKPLVFLSVVSKFPVFPCRRQTLSRPPKATFVSGCPWSVPLLFFLGVHEHPAGSFSPHGICSSARDGTLSPTLPCYFERPYGELRRNQHPLAGSRPLGGQIDGAYHRNQGSDNLPLIEDIPSQ